MEEMVGEQNKHDGCVSHWLITFAFQVYHLLRQLPQCDHVGLQFADTPESSLTL